MTDNQHDFSLSDYEAANLAQALVFLDSVGGNTGDWHGQLLNRLVKLNITHMPNKSAHDQQRDLAARVGWRSLWSI